MRGIEIGSNFNNIYFIGIGGVHMSGLAEILKTEGYNVFGSDQRDSANIEKLRKIGINVFIGHDKANITKDIDVVVYTAAVKPDNLEFAAAEELGIPLWERARLLGRVMQNYGKSICVSGAHGKTTTTSMVSEIFMAAGADPTIMNGGILASINSAMKKGKKDFFIAEACEYYDSFLKLFPDIGVILNIDLDHTDYFDSLDSIYRSFKKFAELIPADGMLVINCGIKGVEQITDGLKCNITTFGLDCGDWQAADRVFDDMGKGSFTVLYKGTVMGRINLSAMGTHNILNSLAACAAAYFSGIDFKFVSEALSTFKGAARRYEYKGTVNGVRIVDDYAHHPTEIRETLNSAAGSSYKKLWCVFQPHTHARTSELLTEFSQCFGSADYVVILDIYSPAGRTENKYNIHSKDLSQKIKEQGKEVFYFPSFDEACDFLSKKCLHNDLLITMGAGDVYKLGEMMLSACQ